MELGCDPGMEDKRERTALDVASAYENVKILELFKRDDGEGKV